MTPESPLPGAKLRRAAHAKANLALAVTGRRPDGYHELRSILVRLALHDDVEVVEVGGPADSLVVESDPDCPVEGNLVLRAAAAVRAHVAGPTPGLAFRLRKRIPMAAGLGGGSSDAAAALEAAADAWGAAIDTVERLRIAAALGADVPFLASGHAAALVEGIGERLRPLRAPDPPAGVLLVTPRRRLATADVFAAWDAAARAPANVPAAVERLATRLASGITGAEAAGLADELRHANGLWHAAAPLAPELVGLRAELEAELRRPVLMTGSGSTLLALYPSGLAADDAALALAASASASVAGARIIATTTHGEGPR